MCLAVLSSAKNTGANNLYHHFSIGFSAHGHTSRSTSTRPRGLCPLHCAGSQGHRQVLRGTESLESHRAPPETPGDPPVPPLDRLLLPAESLGNSSFLPLKEPMGKHWLAHGRVPWGPTGWHPHHSRTLQTNTQAECGLCPNSKTVYAKGIYV